MNADDDVEVVLNPAGYPDFVLHAMPWDTLKIDLCPVHTTSGRKRYKLSALYGADYRNVAFLYVPVHTPQEQIVTGLEGLYDLVLMKWGSP